MKKINMRKVSLIALTIGFISSCINLYLNNFDSTSIVIFISLITIWICSLEEYRKNK